MDSYLDTTLAAGSDLAACVAEAPDAPVSCYEGWDLTDLARHVGTIHRWVTGIVATRATERPAWPDPESVADADLPAWITEGTERLVAGLGAAAPDEEVWTFGPGHTTCVFWRRRMALETVVHRWDAETALGRAGEIDEELALQGIDEALRVYLEPRLEGRDVGGDGQRVALVPHGHEGWTLTLHPTGVGVEQGASSPDTTLTGSASQLWLLLMCRSGLDTLEVAGDRAAAERTMRAAALVPGPAG